MKILKIFLIAVLFSVIGVGSALAIPNLQLYIDGVTFDTTTETWVSTASTFDLWVVGDLDKKTSRYKESDGSYTSNIIKDVTLALAFTGSGGSMVFIRHYGKIIRSEILPYKIHR